MAAPTASQSEAVNLLLVGSTGQGKSTLGNFLLNPDFDHLHGENGKVRTLPVGETRESCTQECKLSRSCDGSMWIMDTPGLNESHERDLQNMIDVVKNAHELSKVHAVVLVMKMESRMHQTYKDVVLYYHKLLGKDAFAANLIIVHPDFKHNSKKYRNKPDKLTMIREQSSEDVTQLLNLPHQPEVICLDSLPEDEEDLKLQLEGRRKILEFASANRAPVALGNLKVPKTEAAKRIHNQRAAQLEGEKRVLEEEKERCMQVPDFVKDRIGFIDSNIAELQRKAKSLAAEIAKLDTRELCETCRFAHTVNPGRLGKHAEFHLVSPVKIQDVTHSGNSDYIESVRGMYEVKGHFSRGAGRWFHESQLNVICWGFKRDYYADRLQQLRGDEMKVNESLHNAHEERMKIYNEHHQLWSHDVKDLEAKIHAKKVEIEQLRSVVFESVEEAERMARELALGQSKL